MWKSCLAGAVLTAAAAFGQTPSQFEIANLREDVRGLTQRVGELALRLEQLERENADLRQRSSQVDRTYATVAQLNEAIAELNRNLHSAITGAKNETLQQVSAQ